MTISDLHLECRQHEAALYDRIEVLEQQLASRETQIKLMDQKAKKSFNCFWNGCGWYSRDSYDEPETTPLKEQDK